MREMQKMVLYYNPAIDITPIILDRMKGQQPRGAAGTNPAAQRPGVQQQRRRIKSFVGRTGLVGGAHLVQIHYRVPDCLASLMYIPRQQRTIEKSAVVEGFGYWSGKDVRVEFRPAPPDTGVVFVRDDLDQAVRIAALVAQRVETPRRTTLRAGGASVEMVEHIMAALAGLRIDNCEVSRQRRRDAGLRRFGQPFVEALVGGRNGRRKMPRERR